MALNRQKVRSNARRHMEKGALDKAVKEYLRLVGEDPEDVQAWLKIGDLRARLGQIEGAVIAYLEAAEVYVKRNALVQAVAIYKERVLRSDPDKVSAHLRLAELYQQLGLGGDATRQYEVVVSYYERMNRTAEVIEVLQNVVEVDPEAVSARVRLAELMITQKRNEEAFPHFRAAMAHLEKRGAKADYLKVAGRLAFLQPKDVSLHRELVQRYIGMGQPQGALGLLLRWLQGAPEDLDALGLLTRVFLGMGQRSKAVSVLKELARIHGERDQRQELMQVYKRILELDPKDEEAGRELYLANRNNAPRMAPSPAPGAPQAPRIAAREGEHLGQEASGGEHQPSGGEVAKLHPQPAKERGSGKSSWEHVNSSTVVVHVQPEFLHDDENQGVDGEEISYRKLPDRSNGEVGKEKRRGREESSHDAPGANGTSFPWELSKKDLGIRRTSTDPQSPPAPASQSEASKGRLVEEVDAYVRFGLVDRAEALIEEALALDPEYVPALERARDLYRYREDRDGAVEVLLRLVEIVGPSEPLQAVGYLHEVLELVPNHGEALLLLDVFDEATEVLGLGKVQSDSFSSAGGGGTLSPGNGGHSGEEELLEVIGEARFFIDQRLYREAERVLEESLDRWSQTPALVDLLDEVRAILRHQEPLSKGEKIPGSGSDLVAFPASVPAVVLKGQNNGERLFKRGVFYKGRKEWESAVEVFKKAMEAGARRAQCHLLIGQCMLEMGRYSSALDWLKRGLRVRDLLPKESVGIQFSIGETYAAMDDPSEAIAYYKSAFELDAEYAGLEERLDRIDYHPS